MVHHSQVRFILIGSLRLDLFFKVQPRSKNPGRSRNFFHGPYWLFNRDPYNGLLPIGSMYGLFTYI